MLALVGPTLLPALAQPAAHQLAPDWWFGKEEQQDKQQPDDDLGAIQGALKKQLQDDAASHGDMGERILDANVARDRAQANGTDWGSAQPEGDKSVTNADCEDWCFEPPGAPAPLPVPFASLSLPSLALRPRHSSADEERPPSLPPVSFCTLPHPLQASPSPAALQEGPPPRAPPALKPAAPPVTFVRRRGLSPSPAANTDGASRAW